MLDLNDRMEAVNNTVFFGQLRYKKQKNGFMGILSITNLIIKLYHLH